MTTCLPNRNRDCYKDIGRKWLNEAGIGMLADYWFWIFRDPPTWQQRSTAWLMSAVEAPEYPLAQPVPGTVHLRDFETDFEDTVPLVFHDERGQ